MQAVSQGGLGGVTVGVEESEYNHYGDRFNRIHHKSRYITLSW